MPTDADFRVGLFVRLSPRPRRLLFETLELSLRAVGDNDGAFCSTNVPSPIYGVAHRGKPCRLDRRRVYVSSELGRRHLRGTQAEFCKQGCLF